MKEPFAGIDQVVFDYVKERIRQLHARFMMEVDEYSSTFLWIESGGRSLASLDISLHVDTIPMRLHCSLWLHGPGKDDSAVESNSWDASDVPDEAALDLLRSETADWVIQQLQLIMTPS
jgi:hypothetical protein